MKPQKIRALVDPQRIFFYGKPKIGKTSMLATLPRHIIIDTEVKSVAEGVNIGGTSYCEGATAMVVSNLTELHQAFKYIEEHQDEFDYVCLDTIDAVEEWVTKKILDANNIKSLSDLSHGKGWYMMRTMVLSIVEDFARISKNFIVIGHQKDGHGEGEIDVTQINLTGKLKTALCSIMDATGHLHRNGDELWVDFRSGESTDAGCRLPRLAGTNQKLDWNFIYQNTIEA